MMTLAVSTAAASDDEPIRAIRFDPAYYYGTGESVETLARRLVDGWAEANVNLIYFLSYSHYYGARYRTDYLYNQEESFGELDLLGVMLPMAKAKGMKVVAWFFDHQHRGAWEEHPEWRVKRPDGSDYKLSDTDCYLSVHQAEVRDYWQGFVEDLLESYPDLDGIDITEPMINWWGDEADYSPRTVELFREEYPGAPAGGAEWRRFKAEGLTRHIHELIEVVHAMGKEVHVTTVFTSRADGSLLSAADYAWETGFDLDGVLSGPNRPDYLNGEVVWQAWENQHGGFDAAWTRYGVEQALTQIGGRVPFVAHVELSRFGNAQPTVEEFGESLAGALDGGALHLDLYDASIADNAGAWNTIGDKYRVTEPPAPKAADMLYVKLK